MKILQKIKSFWKWTICTWWYKFWYGVKVDGFDGSMFPQLGKGKFVSVLRNGPYLEITAHVDYPGVKKGMIRIIPFQPNHGFMIEFVNPDGTIGNRTHCDYRQLALMLGEKSEKAK
jgi:hypothetical protein